LEIEKLLSSEWLRGFWGGREKSVEHGGNILSGYVRVAVSFSLREQNTQLALLMYDAVMHPSTTLGWFLLATCFIFSGSSTAQHANAADGPCQGQASNAEATQCFVDASHAADMKLNQVYARVQEVLGPDEQKGLQVAQRLWLKFRDANCAAERNLYYRGTAASMVHAACIEADTRQRTAELKTMYGWRMKKIGKSFE